MIKFRYNHAKNALLLLERNIGFEKIIQSIADGNLLQIRLYHYQIKYPSQKILYIKIIDQVYAVPYIEENKDTIFLKTLFKQKKNF